MEETDSTDVKYKIRQWSLPGATIVPVLNVSSRVFWLELDDKALLDSYAVLQEGILCDVFSQKCSAAWQGARGERLTVGIMLPGRQDADDWLNFMLSQKNLWPTFTTRGTLTEEISEQVFSKERRRLQAKHLWMVVKLRWGVLVDRMYVKAPTGKSKEELDALLFDRAARRNRTDPYEEKKYRGAGIKEVQAWWKKCQDWMAHFKEQSEPFVFDFKKLLMALSDKEAVAQSEVDAFMENCAKRWQTREGTYQLKRRRLKPDVRDSPEYPGADIDMAVSLSLQISLADLPGPCLGLCVGVACFWLVLFLVGFFLPGKFDFNLMLIPVVDRPCLALVRQCRKKKSAKRSFAASS